MKREAEAFDYKFMRRAIELARETEAAGNLPIGALITIDNDIISEGVNTLVTSPYDPKRHAEMNALDQVALTLWPRANKMTCYTTLEPCCMCFGRLLLSGIGRIVFGAIDLEGGAGCLISHLPPYYHQGNKPIWIGPLMPEICDELFQRSLAAFRILSSGNL